MSFKVNLKMVNTELVNVEEMDFINKLGDYKFPNRVYKNYIWHTKGNESLTYEKAKLKLIRNIILAKEAPTKSGLEYKRVFYYGSLSIHVNINERSICYIKNSHKEGFPLRVSKDKVHILNEIIGIEE